MCAKFSPRPTRPKPDALKTKSINKIQAIELNFLINSFERKVLRYSKKKNLRMNN
jgi:hypothetical protein